MKLYQKFAHSVRRKFIGRLEVSFPENLKKRTLVLRIFFKDRKNNLKNP